MDRVLAIAEEVQEALAAGRGVVALETSVVAQGLPWPHNIEAARRSAAAVRRAGGVPAAVALLDGRAVVGASEDHLLLAAVARATGGAALESNLALLEENAQVAGEVAAALARAR